MIPLRPELVEFMEPASLCRYSCTSKTLCKDVRDTKAWALLAQAQMPCKTRDAVSDALSHVQSQVRRRLLADALSQETPQPQTFRPNRLEDFTYFVRFEEDGRLIWEGDLQCPYEEWDKVILDLRPVWDAIRRARSWIGMERMLTHHTYDDNEGTMALWIFYSVSTLPSSRFEIRMKQWFPRPIILINRAPWVLQISNTISDRAQVIIFVGTF